MLDGKADRSQLCHRKHERTFTKNDDSRKQTEPQTRGQVEHLDYTDMELSVLRHLTVLYIRNTKTEVNSTSESVMENSSTSTAYFTASPLLEKASVYTHINTQDTQTHAQSTLRHDSCR